MRFSFFGFFLAGIVVSYSALADPAQITVGHARFTVVTQNLIRMEYTPDGDFTDAPTLFAIDRKARFENANIKHNGNQFKIDTGEILLTYIDDGKPFSPENLQASIHNGKSDSKWAAGAVDPLNLGGTLRTLDQISGPVDMGHGLISRSGWAVVDDSKSPVLTADWVESRKNQGETDWYLFGYGLDFPAALKSLTAISGPVPIPRKNLLGIWYSRYWPYTSADYRKIVQEYSEHGFPLDNIVMDMDWHITQAPGVKRAYAGLIWTGYTWDRKLLPDAEELLKWFHQQGLFITLNDHPADGVQPHEQMYTQFMKAMGENPAAGQTIPFDAGSKKYLDTFYQYTHVPHEKEGVDFWWLDWQQYPFTKSVGDLSNLAWLNHYYFQQTSADNKRGVSFSRWAGWGDQRDPIHFSGDASTDWSMLAFEVPFTSTSGNVGCFFWTHDIGGHRGSRNEESYTRWCQFGALSASLRSHSTRNAQMDRRPWTYPKWAEDSMRVAFQLRSQLFPYIYASAAQSCAQSVPLLRPMYFQHSDQEAAYHNAQEYYFGDDLLVAPIATPGTGPTRMAWQTVWFPANSGPWYNYFTGERYEPGSEAVVAADINQFPLFVRAGVPLPMQPYVQRPATAPLDHLAIRCYPGNDNQPQTYSLYEDDGQSRAYENGASATTKLTATRSGNQTTIEISATSGKFDGQNPTRSYTIELHCLAAPTAISVDGAVQSPTYDAASNIVRVEIPARSIKQSVTVQVRADTADQEQIHQRAVAQRLSGIVGREIHPDTVKQMLATAIQTKPAQNLMSAIFASAGVAVVPTNDAPYLFGGKEIFRVFAPENLLDSTEATTALVSSDGSEPTVSKPIQLTNGQAIDVQSLTGSLTGADAVSVPGRSPVLRLTTKFAGADCMIDVSAPGFSNRDLDLARSAKVSASSTESGYTTSGAVDGIADGYPGPKKNEWSSNHETVGAWLKLSWETDQEVSEVDLYDRPNDDDQITAGKIVFSDGSSVPFGELPNDGKSPGVVHFPQKKIDWLRVEITAVSPTTKNAGLAEVAVFK